MKLLIGTIALLAGCQLIPDQNDDGGGGGSSCADDEVEGPDGACWSRCRSDERWLGDRCSDGTGYWVQPAALEACGPGRHLATRDEMRGLLDSCATTADGDLECYSCDASDACAAMYLDTDVVASNIWTSTPCTLPPPLTGDAAYLADMDDGTITCFWTDQNVGYPLCVDD